MSKVLLVTSNFPPVKGGSSSVYSNLSRCAPEIICVLTAKCDYTDSLPQIGWREFDLSCNARVKRIPLVRPPILHAPTMLRRIHARIKEVIIRVRVSWTIVQFIVCEDVRTICVGELIACGWIARVTRFFPLLTSVIYIHGEELTTKDSSDPKKMRIRSTLRSADALVVVSKFTRDALLAIDQRLNSRTHLITNGVDTERFCEGPKSEELVSRYCINECFVFVSVCRLVEKKGVDNALRAFAKIAREFSWARFLVVGSGPYLPELKRVVDEERIGGSVVFIGSVPESLLVEHYRLGDAFVMPNREMPDGDTEGFGLVFLEANSCGLPVIAGRDGGSIEAVRHGHNGLIVDGRSVESIYSALKSIMVDSDLRDRLREGGRKAALESNWSEKTKLFVEVVSSQSLSRQDN